MVRIDSSETSDPVDPLVDCSSFSLFPVSFNRPAASSTVDDPNPNFDLHSHLKALVLRSPDKLLKQAKSIIDESMKLNNPPAMASDDKAEKVSSMNDKNHQEKRPALGLKKAKFSAKPMSSQPDVVPEPSIDIGKLNDPVEFFAAYERMENAKKELQRLRGAPLSNLDQNLPSMSPRRRRPSLYGKSATYKHHSYSSTMMSDIGETFLSSQETSQKHTASPARQDVVQETEVVNNSQHVRVPDMTPAMETNEVNELDELLSCDYGRLDETGVLDLLQHKLQIKLRDIGKPTLPDFHHVQRQVSETSGDTLPQMTDAITRLNGIRKAVGSTRLSLSSQLRESSGHIQAVPAQPKSPLASISLLNRHISKRSPSKDPFSTLDNDLSPVRIHSPEMVRRKLSDRMDTRKHLSESQTSLVRVEQIPAAVNPLPCSEENTTAQGIEPNNQLDGVGQSDPNGVRKDLLEHGGSTANGEEANAVSSVVSSSLAEKDMSSGSEPTEQIDGAAQADTMTNFCDFRRSLLHRDQSVADFGKEPVASVAKGIKDVSEDKNQEDEVDARRDSVQQELNIGGSVTDKSTDNQAEECTTGNASNSRDVEIEEPAEEAAEPSNRKMKGRKQSKAASKRNASKEAAKKGGIENPESDIPVSERPENKKRKAEGAPQSNKQKHINRRNSLYAAGTKWEAGIRRSTRIRMRPLEYWKGERFLYGRVHASLVTVIGVKYASPTKEAEQPPVKVKSFVSDEYKELVDLAALH